MSANTYNVALPFQSETPTLGAEGTTTWKGLWTDEGIYVYVTVNDDEWYPAYMNSASDNWMYDKVEIYFDVNAELKDGIGAGGGAGHIQVAPPATEDGISGTLIEDGDGQHAYMVTNPTWAVEYFIPFSRLKDKDGVVVPTDRTIGFDVTAIDGESAAPGVRQRAVWANDGKGPAANESYSNMDDCGTITLSEEVAEGGGMVKKTDVKPVIDGVIDAVWENANKYDISVPFQAELATVGDEGETYWKALWDAEGMYIMVNVADDHWFPNWAPDGGANSYEYDKLELYFDTNVPRVDGTGGQGGTPGSIQIAPESKDGILDGTMQTITAFGADYNFAIRVTDPAYVCEYFIPWDIVNDKNGTAFDKLTSMGFDVTVIDRDPGDAARKRVNWANAGAINENWANMDDAGVIMFAGATEVIPVDKVKVAAGGTITTDNGTLQMVAVVEPADASSQSVKWTVENGTGRATINSKGILTGVVDGIVTVKAMATDGYFAEGKTTVTISGQVVTMSEINYVKNGNFDNVTATGSPVDWNNGTVTDGVLTFGPAAVGVNQWDYSNLQQTHIPFELKDEDFVISFKAWADEPRTLPLVFEDAFNDGAQWDAYAYSADPGWSDKTWTVNLTTEPTIYTMDFNFSKMQETTVQNMNFQVAMSTAPIHLDSIYIVRKADLALVTSARSLANAKSKVQLYPNPVQTELIVSKIAVANSKVSVYNAVGQKLIERTANGNQAKFDVSNLRKGMYFVRFSDGSSEKFLKQ